MHVKITRQNGYRCAPDGAVVHFFALGAIVTGKAAILALEDGAGEKQFDPREETKVIAPPEVKRRGRPRKDSK